jgi:hypothetical protein
MVSSSVALTSDWPGGTPVTILTQGVTGTDALGNDIYGTIATTVVNAVLEPLMLKLAPRATRASSFAESRSGQYIVSAGYTAFFPPGTQIGLTDLVVINEETWEVSGTPGAFQSPFTGAPGVLQVELLKITG